MVFKKEKNSIMTKYSIKYWKTEGYLLFLILNNIRKCEKYLNQIFQEESLYAWA